MRFKGKTVIVTGGSAGIGRSIALRFGSEGANVVIGARVKGDLEKTAKEIKAAGAAVLAVSADIANESQAKHLIAQATQRFGAVDVLVNNAARVGRMGHFMDMPAEEWEQAFRTNLLGTMFCSREVLRVMQPRKTGVIINITSLAALTGFYPTMPYNESKAGINSLTIDMARMAAADGIRVNGVALGPTHTRSMGRTTSGALPGPVEKLWDWFGMAKPAGKPLSGEDVAGVVAFLASPEAGGITGQIVTMVTRVQERQS
jgi:3-oxoacyl-[acyl-carrier protein] reductase